MGRVRAREGEELDCWDLFKFTFTRNLPRKMGEEVEKLLRRMYQRSSDPTDGNWTQRNMVPDYPSFMYRRILGL